MVFFGKSEAELKQIASDLDKRHTDLDNRDSALKSAQLTFEHDGKSLEDAQTQLESERKEVRAEAKKAHECVASEKAELEKRRIELSKLEAEAKAGFVEKQREAFKEAIEKRIAELDVRQQELDGLEKQLSAKLKDLHATEAEISKRELAVTEREQKADAGFADKTKTLADEAARQHKANQTEAKRLRKQADAIGEERQNLEVAKAKLVQREQALVAAEQKRDAGFADERAGLDIELRDKRDQIESEIADHRTKKLSACEDEIANLKAKRLEDITNAEQAERDRIGAEIAKEREAWTEQRESARKQLESEQTEREKQKGAVSALQSELEGRKMELEANEWTLEQKEQRLDRQWQKRNDDLDDKLEARLEEERQSLETMKQSLKNENTRLREGLSIQLGLVGAYDQYEKEFEGRHPAEVIRDLHSKTDELKRLHEELTTRPTEADRERYREMESEVERQKARMEELEKQIDANAATIAETADLRRNNSEIAAENKSLAQRASRFEDAANEAQAELNRLRAAYERPAEVAARYKEIEAPHIKMGEAKQATKADVDEIKWLTDVGDACDSYGLHFNPRILKAFHTALKTAEWSPLTVLAGVSGTGKSELPRLYSHFGGLVFEPLSVQPNWDSQESMLGFFNSIDNKFDAQPVLRFLAQSQKAWTNGAGEDDSYPGLRDAVCLILLDEMNLAHPELYFAEFLSKLELRRGMGGSDVPFLPVKIGAGKEPYQLPLGRNVLWVGTMNQDETTKSLSAKVLDRSIIIHFPRPTTLNRRVKLTKLNENNRGPLLHKTSWQSWLAQETSFSEEDVKPFKNFVEATNVALAVAGRAIGHRVWQSIEYYMANYPDVRAAQKAKDNDELAKALHTAFEDQLVQKVMPKLRGIDTRGESLNKCLNKIRDQLTAGLFGKQFNLAKDFDLACELGHGQFIWQTANYLNDTDPATNVLAAVPETKAANGDAISSETADTDLSKPPADWLSDDPDRVKQWNKKNTKQKQRYHQSSQDKRRDGEEE
jgi:hypothetical protein